MARTSRWRCRKSRRAPGGEMPVTDGRRKFAPLVCHRAAATAKRVCVRQKLQLVNACACVCCAIALVAANSESFQLSSRTHKNSSQAINRTLSNPRIGSQVMFNAINISRTHQANLASFTQPSKHTRTQIQIQTHTQTLTLISVTVLRWDLNAGLLWNLVLRV